MNTSEYLKTYSDGWEKGDARLILQGVSDDFVYDDLNAGGPIGKEEFEVYFAKFKQQVESLRGGKTYDKFLTGAEVLLKEQGGVVTGWSWWSIAGTKLQGGALLKAGPNGVFLDRVTYYTSFPM